jgi:lysophospholipase L1-like esterase
MRSRVTVPLGVLATSIATGALVSGQAIWATRRKDLPSVVGADASGTEGDPALPAVHVTCAGDSTLTGPGLDHPGQTWVRLAARTVAQDLHVVKVRSFAVGGSCVGDVLDHQLDELLASGPDVAVVAVGSNDALRLSPLHQVDAGFRLLVATLSEHVPRVVIGGVGDLGAIARVPAPLSTVIGVRGRQVDRIIGAPARRTNVRRLDVSSADSAFRAAGRHVFTPDLFHPNQYGHAIWAESGADRRGRHPQCPAARTVHRPAGGTMTVTDVTVDTADGPMRLSRGDAGRPGQRAVIVVMEAFGVSDHIETSRRRRSQLSRRALICSPAVGARAYDDFATVRSSSPP